MWLLTLFLTLAIILVLQFHVDGKLPWYTERRYAFLCAYLAFLLSVFNRSTATEKDLLHLFVRIFVQGNSHCTGQKETG